MKIQCPECGAEVEFRFDDSMVRVCKYCRAAVARTDRGVESLGQVADLVPIDSALRLYATGSWQGTAFTLVGKAQIEHAAGGIWQEWYAHFSDGRWGWIAEHQGRVSVAFESKDRATIAFGRLVIGQRLGVGKQTYTVAEIGAAKYRAAEGELPYRLDPGTAFAFADLSDGFGGFATFDYDDPNRLRPEPVVYAGKWTTIAALGLSGGEVPTIPVSTAAKTLACPECGGSITLRVPDASLRVACPYCTQLISTEVGEFRLLGKLKQKPQPEIPLGTQVKLPQGQFVVVGYLVRAAFIDESWYRFYEYLLHSRELGFRWLVSSDGHWSYVEPVDPGAVEDLGNEQRYHGVTFRAFQTCTLRVEEVWGELYWRVEVGETSQARDAIAPPAMLSRETTRRELNQSLCTYLTLDEVKAATGVALLDQAQGVAPNQPPRFVGLGRLAAILLMPLIAIGFFAAVSSHPSVLRTLDLAIPPGKPAPPPATEAPAGVTVTAEDAPGNVFFSEPFAVASGQNVEVEVVAQISNSWAYVAVDLFEESSGTFVTIDKEVEYYAGYTDGESWSEGSTRGSTVIGPIKGGTYVARLEAIHGSATPIELHVVIRQNVYRAVYFFVSLVLLMILFAGALIVRHKREETRWENSGHYGPPGTPKAAGHDDEEDDE